MTSSDHAAAEGYRRLACAILLRAVEDARNTNGHKQAQGLGLPPGQTLAGDAKLFLFSEGARNLVLLLDLDPAGLERALEELPAPEWEQARLMGLG